MTLLIKYTLIYGIVLMLVALGACYSERSGVINIAMEGIMVIGGVMGLLIMVMLPPAMPAVWKVTVTILASAGAGLLYSSLLAFSAINLKADQTIGGTALNLLATALALVLVKRYNNSMSGGTGTQSPKLNFTNSDFIFNIGPITVNVFLFVGLVLLVVAMVVLYKTRFGMRLMACGEHPQAADSVGINVYRMRWAGVLISGFLGGIGGLAYIVPAVQTWNFEGGVMGMGFLAIAVMIFGQWRPGKIFLAAMFFAMFKALANIYDSTFLSALNLTKEVYNMMPFLASMVILAFTSKNSRAPKAEGIPYDKGQR